MMFGRIAPEQHDTLDNIPEPAENPLLAGHNEAADMLVSAWRTGKLPHALLFSGPRGIGKATFAFHLTWHLLSDTDRSQPPGHLNVIDPFSSQFRQIAIGAHPSVLYLTRPLNEKTRGHKSAITVDEIRKVSRFLALTVHDGGYRVIIVDPADDMNVNAANALLKNLEEPPAQTLFILIAHSPGLLLPTIRSRCQSIRFNPLNDDEVMSVLESFDISLPADKGERAALAANAAGSPRTAILLTRHGGLEIAGAVDQLLRSPALPVLEVHKLANAVSGRDNSIAFELFNDYSLDLLAAGARDAALRGNIELAQRFSHAWQEFRVAINDTGTYNLDRKQHVLDMISRLHRIFRI